MTEPCAIYSLYPASPQDLHTIAQACEQESADPSCGSLTEYMFAAPQPVQPSTTTIDELVAHHRANTVGKYPDPFCGVEPESVDEHEREEKEKEAGHMSTFDKNYFAVATTPEWRTKGICAVTCNKYDVMGADSDEEDAEDDGDEVDNEGVTNKEKRTRGWDSHFFKAEAVGIMFVNLQIANMGWDEYLEWEDTQPGAGRDEGDEDERKGDEQAKEDVKKGGEAPRKRLISNKEEENLKVEGEV